MLTIVEKILFIVAVAASLYFGYRGFISVYRVIRRGQPDGDGRSLIARAWDALTNWLLLLPTWKVRLWPDLFHAAVAWGFTFYFLVNFGDVIQGYFPITFLGRGPIGNAYRFIGDVLSVGVIVGVIYFLVRRFIFRSPVFNFRNNVTLQAKVKAGGLRRDSLIVGAFILFHVGSRFLGDTFGIALERADGVVSAGAGQPFAGTVSNLWSGLGPGALTVGNHLFWWLGLGAILAFIPYFPYTKHFHLIMSGINFLVRPKRTSLGTLQPIDFEDESVEQMGTCRIEQLPWKGLVDAYACIMCNRCQDACPAYTTGKELSPSAMEINKRYYLNDHLHMLARGAEAPDELIGSCTSESAVWACTACGACIEVCPVGNEPMFDFMYLRRHLVLMDSSFPKQLQTAFKGMERNGNPWNLSKKERLAWTKGLNIPTIDDNPEPDILWWVGCAPAYDARAQATAKAFARILEAAGVNYAILGQLENCTGDSARRAGNEALYYQLAQGNVEILNEVNPKRIVTTCPHCFQTLGKEYYQFGGNYNVVHSTQYLWELLDSGQLKLAPYRTEAAGKITYHDPCYLGRHNGVYDAPRDVLAKARLEIVEMERSYNKSFCCGAGGAQMWKEEEHGSEEVYVNRFREANATGASTVVVACPFCLTMLTDASKRLEGIPVKDVAELIAERLPV
jgi:Fe-S oxidoreductase